MADLEISLLGNQSTDQNQHDTPSPKVVSPVLLGGAGTRSSPRRRCHFSPPANFSSSPQSRLFVLSHLRSCTSSRSLLNPPRPGYIRAVDVRRSQSAPLLPYLNPEAGSTRTSTDRSTYHQRIVPIKKGFKVCVSGTSELKPLWELVLEKRELEAFVKNTLKEGREHSKILGFVVGSLVVLFSALVDAEIADGISNMTKANLARCELLLPDSTPRKAPSTNREAELKDIFDSYSAEIGAPLPIHWDKSISFTELNGIAVTLFMAFVFKGRNSKN